MLGGFLSKLRILRKVEVCVIVLIGIFGGKSEIANAEDEQAANSAFETLVSNERPKMVVGYFDSKEGQVAVLMESRDGLAVIEGDIVAGPIDKIINMDSAKGLTDVRSNLWSNGEVPYELPPDFPDKDAVMEAFNHYHQETKIRFVPRASQHQSYIQFTVTSNPNIGGQSYLGQRGGVQELWLNVDTTKWSKGTVIHEIGHALGLMHEQCRGDREKYVEILWDHIIPAYYSQFTQLYDNGRDLQAYDYDSILHYPPKAFTMDENLVTIKPRKAGVEIGQRKRLSEGDIASLHELYASELSP